MIDSCSRKKGLKDPRMASREQTAAKLCEMRQASTEGAVLTPLPGLTLCMSVLGTETPLHFSDRGKSDKSF